MEDIVHTGSHIVQTVVAIFALLSLEAETLMLVKH
jgi:hypothetical protein